MHNRSTDEFHRYLLSGGMPDVVSSLLQTHNIQEVRARQRDIADLYRLDISKYAGNRARTVRRIFDLIPAELNTQSKRFAFGHIEGMSRFNRYDNDFTWLVGAGIVIPVCNVDERAIRSRSNRANPTDVTAPCRRRLKSRIMALNERLCCMRAMWKCVARWRISRCI